MTNTCYAALIQLVRGVNTREIESNYMKALSVYFHPAALTCTHKHQDNI